MLPGPIFDQKILIPKRFDTKTSLGQKKTWYKNFVCQIFNPKEFGSKIFWSKNLLSQ